VGGAQALLDILAGAIHHLEAGFAAAFEGPGSFSANGVTATLVSGRAFLDIFAFGVCAVKLESAVVAFAGEATHSVLASGREVLVVRSCRLIAIVDALAFVDVVTNSGVKITGVAGVAR
jgi:hypothetical protein